MAAGEPPTERTQKRKVQGGIQAGREWAPDKVGRKRARLLLQEVSGKMERRTTKQKGNAG